jgi:hypothetical protein
MANSAISQLNANNALRGDQLIVARSGSNWRVDAGDFLCDHPGYIVGNWYFPSFGTITTGSAPGANSIRFIPFVPVRKCTIGSLGVRITTTGTSCQLAIYASGANGKPTGNALGSTGNISATSAANVTGTLQPAAVQVQPGTLYYLAVNQDNAATVYQSLGLYYYGGFVVGGTQAEISSSATAGIQGWFFASTFNTWPDMTGQSPSVLTTAAHAAIQFNVSSVP